MNDIIEEGGTEVEAFVDDVDTDADLSRRKACISYSQCLWSLALINQAMGKPEKAVTFEDCGMTPLSHYFLD